MDTLFGKSPLPLSVSSRTDFVKEGYSVRRQSPHANIRVRNKALDGGASLLQRETGRGFTKEHFTLESLKCFLYYGLISNSLAQAPSPFLLSG